MYRVLIWAILAIIVIRLALRLFRGVLEGMGHQPRGGQKSLGLVRDPICGTFVSPTSALTSGSGADTRYFCSEKCRQAYGSPR